MAEGLITLGEMRAKGMTMPEVACRRGERRGRPRIERRIAEHGAGVLGRHRGRLAAHAERRGLDPRPWRALPRGGPLVPDWTRVSRLPARRSFFASMRPCLASARSTSRAVAPPLTDTGTNVPVPSSQVAIVLTFLLVGGTCVRVSRSIVV